MSQELKAREVVSKLFEKAGGSVGCTSASEEPRNRKQVYNACQLTGSKGKDPILHLIEQLRHHKLLGSEAFVCEVGLSNFPFCIGALEKQLGDIQRFCTDPNNFCVLGVDGTFNLGKFYVTLTTYEHLMLRT